MAEVHQKSRFSWHRKATEINGTQYDPNIVCSDNVVEQGPGRTAGAASLECRQISPFSMNLASFVLVVDRKNLRRQVA